MVQIKNEVLTVEINPFGAELYSIKNSQGYEFIYDGKAYKLDKHGFARLSDFEVELVEDNKAVFLLKNNDELRKQYPFEFEFRVIFTLNKNSLVVEYRVDNIDNKDIYFSIIEIKYFFNKEFCFTSVYNHYIITSFIRIYSI